MKTKLQIFIFLLVSLLTGCSLEDNNNISDLNYSESSIHGQWYLRRASSGGTSHDNSFINRGLIKWIFNLQDMTLTVENNSQSNPNDILLGFLPSGIYDFTLTEQDETLYISLDNWHFMNGARISHNNNELNINSNYTLEGSGADYPNYMLER